MPNKIRRKVKFACCKSSSRHEQRRTKSTPPDLCRNGAAASCHVHEPRPTAMAGRVLPIGCWATRVWGSHGFSAPRPSQDGPLQPSLNIDSSNSHSDMFAGPCNGLQDFRWQRLMVETPAEHLGISSKTDASRKACLHFGCQRPLTSVDDDDEFAPLPHSKPPLPTRTLVVFLGGQLASWLPTWALCNHKAWPWASPNSPAY